MLKYYIQPAKRYNGLLYRERKVILDEKMIERVLTVPEAIVYSSWRSLAEQKKLLAEGKTKTLYSNHRRGLAVDIINWKEVEPKMRKVRLINDISWDRNHFTLGGEAVAAKEKIYDSLPAKLEEYKPPKPVDPTKPKPQGIASDVPKPEKPPLTPPQTPQDIVPQPEPQKPAEATTATPSPIPEPRPLPTAREVIKNDLEEIFTDLINLIKKLWASK